MSGGVTLPSVGLTDTAQVPECDGFLANKPDSHLDWYFNAEFISICKASTYTVYHLLLQLAEMEASISLQVKVCAGWSFDTVLLLNSQHSSY